MIFAKTKNATKKGVVKNSTTPFFIWQKNKFKYK